MQIIDFETKEFTKSETTIKNLKKSIGLKEDATVQDVVDFYIKKYEITQTESGDVEKIIPLRYEIATKGYTSYKSVTIAKEISDQSIQEIEERNNEFSKKLSQELGIRGWA